MKRIAERRIIPCIIFNSGYLALIDLEFEGLYMTKQEKLSLNIKRYAK